MDRKGYRVYNWTEQENKRSVARNRKISGGESRAGNLLARKEDLGDFSPIALIKRKEC
jgi:hypothetical protein